MVVTIHGPAETKPKYAVWGADNRPAREFASQFELKRYRAVQEGKSFVFVAEVAMRVASTLLRASYPWFMDFVDNSFLTIPRGNGLAERFATTTWQLADAN